MSTPPAPFEQSTASVASMLSPSNASLYNDTIGAGASVYDSALENSTSFASCDGNAAFTDYESTVNNRNISGKHERNPNISASMLLLQSESTETNASQEEVDPKSQLANKTIFKTDNPNLSIIEISDSSLKSGEDLESSVLVIESSSDDERQLAKSTPNKSPKTTVTTAAPASVAHLAGAEAGVQTATTTDAEKRRKKAETLIHSSKQKLNVAIAEAFAHESSKNDGTSVGDGDQQQHSKPRSNVKSVGNKEDETTDTKRDIMLYETIEEFENNLPSTVTVLDTPFGSKVYLVGTAHFSEESQDDVSYVIRNVRPDVVMVELCPSRIHILKLDEKTLLEEVKNFNLAKIRSIIQAHGYINGIFFILLLQMSAQIAKDLGMAPGGEFRRAFEEIHKLPGCMLHLGDRPIRVTLHRALRALSLWQTIKLVWRLTSSDTISIEEVEECKQRDLLEKLMEEMAGEFPAFSDVFVNERDIFLCHSLQLAALPQAPTDGTNVPRPVRVVGVVGIGHAKGIAKLWGHVDPQKIPAIMEIPPARRTTRVFKFTLKYGLIGLTLFGAFRLMRPRLTRFL